MLISRVAEVNEEADVGGARGEPAAGARGGQDHARELYDHDYEFQTANELYDLMAKNYPFDETDENTLSKRDLVILYKNIDIGTTLMSNANELKHRRPNQHVETIIYNEDPESDCSDISEICSAEDLHNLVLINKERIDLFNNRPSLQNTLCHKLGGLEIQSSDLTTEYDNHFLFKDPYIKEQLNNFNLSCCSNGYDGTILPASLLDYICCKRLEDNHNFYMDNVIRYVKHTIDQLKRISNGDYLTDKAKEKWREVEYTAKERYEDNTKVLATSTSIPLHVERKFGGHASTWDDIVHSEVDVRTLSKILEKKIVVEIPNILYGSYRLFSKRCDDNLIISCKRDKPSVACKREGKSRVDLVLQLQRSQSGLVMSNINSIVTLHTTPAVQRELGAIDVLPIPYDGNIDESIENQVKIIEQNNVGASIPNVAKNMYCAVDAEEIPREDEQYNNSPVLYNFDYSSDDKDLWQFNKDIFLKPTDSSNSFRNILNKKAQTLKKEASVNRVTPDDLWFTIQKLNMQSSLPEESAEDLSTNVTNKKKSPTRVRIKSPYENKSYAMEEKKRKRLLEIREKREKKKIALGENCKITKHKYGKVVMPQASSSVTKLSITNKSFYNSIYGQAVNVESSQQKKGRMKRKDNIILEVPLAQMEGEYESPMETPEKNSKKYENRSYYLDDAVTEVMYMEMKKKESNEDKDLCSASTSAVSNEICENFSLLSQLMAPSATEYSHLNFIENTNTFDGKLHRLDNTIASNGKKEHENNLISSRSILNMVPPTNSPVNPCTDDDKNDPKKSTSSVECRKSIDKIYDLMKKLGKIDQTEMKEAKCKFSASNTESMEIICGRASSTVQGSDSGTSIKHNLTSSNPSCFSFQKTNTNEAINLKIMLTKKPETATAAVPNVINSKMAGDRMKKERRNVTVSHPSKGTDNPLKAISQLIHEFDNVQKIRQKNETKTVKKPDVSGIDGKNISRLTANQSNLKRRSRLEEHLNDKEIPIDRYSRATPRDRKIKQVSTIELSKTLYQHYPTEEKNIERPKKKINDLTDEAKEARGEAVRGPSKMNRLNTLAQPKRSYVQAHSEEYQTKYGKNLMADRLHRLAATPAPGPVTERTFTSANSKYRLRRSGTEVVSPVSGRPPPPSPPPLDKPSKARRSKSSSPEGRLPPAIVPSLKTYVPDSPELLKKKMVSVESYMKNRGRVTQAPGNTDLLQSVAKSRFPLIPRDIELESITSSSVEESTQVGSKLHRIINTMINTVPSLAVLTECHETVSRKDNIGDSMYQNADNISQSLNNNDSICSDHCNAVFDETQVSAAVKDVEKEEYKVIPEEDTIKTKEIGSLNSETEMEQLENALYRKMSGTFQKRLRIKNLTLTPKQSLQQVFVLQSGDAASMLVKSTISQNGSVKSEKSALTTWPILTNSHIDWSFAKFPMQIATVEYGLPKYQTVQCGPSSKIKLDFMCQNSSDTNLVLENVDKSNKTSQCFKGQSNPQVRKTAETKKLTNSDNCEVKADCLKWNKMVEAGTEPRSNTQTTLTSTTIPIYDKTDKENLANDTSETETVDYTSSLDMLVGLLNEIQKITSCQANITNTQNNNEQKDIESVLNDAASFEGPLKTNPHELVSMSSLDELRQLDSNPSIYSFYFSKDGDRLSIDNAVKMDHDMAFKTYNLIDAPYSKPIYADKEVSVDVLDRTYVNRFTEIPSHFFPKAVNHSTNVTNSLVRVLSEPSCYQPTLSLKDYQTNCTKTKNNIIELRQVSTSTDSQHAFTLTRLPDDKIKKSGCKQKATTNIPVKSIKKNNVWSKKIVVNSNFLMNGQDPLIKMKRDILVTVYSILVLTVFAALSFPEMLYRT